MERRQYQAENSGWVSISLSEQDTLVSMLREQIVEQNGGYSDNYKATPLCVMSIEFEKIFQSRFNLGMQSQIRVNSRRLLDY